MTTVVINENIPILVEFAPALGIRDVSITSKDIEQKSTEALNSAMNTIHQMTTSIVATINTVRK
jgi:hypothetical protein